jgi:hypothetical protein
MVHIDSECSNATRLALCDRLPGRGGVDGAWWPKSDDLRTELPDLVAVLGLLIGPVHRIVYDPSRWPHAPSRIIRGAAPISVDPYALVSSDTIYLVGTHMRKALLFVLPQSSHEDAADRVLRAVTDATGPMSVTSMRHLVAHFAVAARRSAQPAGVSPPVATR